jgi:hypothetical protein
MIIFRIGQGVTVVGQDIRAAGFEVIPVEHGTITQAPVVRPPANRRRRRAARGIALPRVSLIRLDPGGPRPTASVDTRKARTTQQNRPWLGFCR